MDYNALLLCRTNIGGYFFDAYFDFEHNSELQITEHPIETGAAVVDHAYLKPKTLTVTVGMSDVHISRVSGQFTGGWSRSAKAYDLLKEMQASRMPIAVLTRLGLYENMLIQKISVKDDVSTLTGLRATVTLREIPVARLKTVKVSANPHSTDSTQMGSVQAVPTTQHELQSMMYQAFGVIY